jgi:hypothetical protein
VKHLAMRAAATCLVVIAIACNGGSRVDTPATDWAGVWEYAANSGTTAGGSPITLHYQLRVAERGATPEVTLVIRGFQTDETLLGTVDATPDRLTVRFHTYDGGSTLNAYGVAEHHAGDSLITLTREDVQQPDHVTTEWRGLDPPQDASTCLKRSAGIAIR